MSPRVVGCRVLVADPPWKFSDKIQGDRGQASKYPGMPTAEIKAFPLPPLGDSCVLFLWRVAAMQRDALDVLEAWGFELNSELVWNKMGVDRKPCKTCGIRPIKRHFGMGHIVRGAHETCLIGTRGRVRDLGIAHKSQRTTFDAPVPRYPNGRVIHSAKPDEFFRIVESLTPKGPHVELFARRTRPGWYCLGNETTKLQPTGT